MRLRYLYTYSVNEDVQRESTLSTADRIQYSPEEESKGGLKGRHP